MKRFSTLVQFLPFLWISLLIPVYIQAQNTGIIRGKILTRTQRAPLAGTNVMLLGTVLGTSTDNSGSFSIERIPPGMYTLRISMMGYHTEIVKDIVVRANQVTETTILLHQAVIAANPIIVTASKHPQTLSSSPQAVTVIPVTRIEERQCTRLEDTVNDVAGVYFNEDNISIRGSSGWSAFNVGSRVLLLIDGIPLIISDIGAISWEMLPLLDIDRIEVVKGAGSALYGSSAMGGVINILTRRPSSRGHFQMRTLTGIYDQPHYDIWRWTNKTLHYEGADISYSRKIGPVGFRLGVSRFISTGYMENNAIDRWNVTGRFLIRFSNASSLDLGLQWMKSEKGGFIQWLDQNSPFEVPSYNREDEIHFKITNLYATYYLPLSLRLGLKFRISSIISLAGNQLTTMDPGSFKTSQGPGGEIQANWIPSKNHFITIGSEFRWDISGSEYFGDHLGYSISPYIQDEFTLLSNLRTTFGFRLDSHRMVDERTETHLNPKIGLNYRPFRGTVLHLAGGSGFRAATVFEKYISADYSGFTIIPNPELQSEHSWSTDIGLDQTITENGQIQFSFFQNNISDMIEPVRDFLGTIQFQNYAQARIRGVEGTAESWWWHRRVGVRGNLTWLDPRNLLLDEILPYRPKLTFLFSVTLKMKQLLFEAEYRYASRVEKVEINPLDARVPLKLLNLRIQVKWQRITLQLAVHNALNYHYTQIERRMGEIRKGSITLLMDMGGERR